MHSRFWFRVPVFFANPMSVSSEAAAMGVGLSMGGIEQPSSIKSNTCCVVIRRRVVKFTWLLGWQRVLCHFASAKHLSTLFRSFKNLIKYLVRNNFSTIEPNIPRGVLKVNSSIIFVPVLSTSNECLCFIDEKLPLIISSSKYKNGSILVIFTVSFCLMPKWIASQVIMSPASHRTEVRPATTLSCVFEVDNWWASILRARSKQVWTGASIKVVK